MYSCPLPLRMWKAGGDRQCPHSRLYRVRLIRAQAARRQLAGNPTATHTTRARQREEGNKGGRRRRKRGGTRGPLNSKSFAAARLAADHQAGACSCQQAGSKLIATLTSRRHGSLVPLSVALLCSCSERHARSSLCLSAATHAEGDPPLVPRLRRLCSRLSSPSVCQAVVSCCGFHPPVH
jgi:hypothetical protein